VGQVLRTGREARVDDYAKVAGDHARMLRETIGIRSGVAAPIRAAGRLWGAIAVSEFGDRNLPEDAELRLAQFAELLAQAIANAETRRQLIESRARLVTSADEARRRLERDLHDGAQQRLVSLAIGLRMARAAAPDEATREALAACSDELGRALDELRELARGIHPVMLSERGLKPAMQAVADRSSVPVRVEVDPGERLAPAQEAALYFTASEALANVARYASAAEASIEVRRGPGEVTLTVRDDGVGGADMGKGTGLRGLADRVEALGGTLEVVSPPGAGTTLRATLPL
jgi:signal transduction histidine kinase